MEEGLNYSKLMDLFNAQTGTVNILWNIFVAVSLGVLGFVLKERDLRENRKIKLAFSIGFIIFAIGNLTAITRSQEILVAISDILRNAATKITQTEYRSVFEAYSAQSVSQIKTGHRVISAIIVLGIWLPDIAARIQGRGEAAKIE
ncbi:MAG TPA: hypothetical protein VNP98_12500 [Chthoniobacterales bacterium]|nr:hypothetical protein [Chthoniobacterales bacterium]